MDVEKLGGRSVVPELQDERADRFIAALGERGKGPTAGGIQGDLEPVRVAGEIVAQGLHDIGAERDGRHGAIPCVLADLNGDSQVRLAIKPTPSGETRAIGEKAPSVDAGVGVIAHFDLDRMTRDNPRPGKCGTRKG